jgi:hypothetical protein
VKTNREMLTSSNTGDRHGDSRPFACSYIFIKIYQLNQRFSKSIQDFCPPQTLHAKKNKNKKINK